jgi:hypothetical protein
VKRPEQKIPSKVWKDIMADLCSKLGSDPSEQQQRTMKDNLRSYLDDLSTGTANGENDSRPELQKEEVLRHLKATDTYASKVILTKRHELIGTQPTPKKARVVKMRLMSPDSNQSDQNDEARDPEMNRKEARARTTQAIEKVSESIAVSIQQQADNICQSKERFSMEQERHNSRKVLEAISIEKKTKETIKAELELLRMQLDFNLITKSEFETKAKSLFE